ncbi:hypothetical protein KI427_10315 [Rhodococcus ruber]|uniref:hypothetical protein n=1 Tax=Rhodococcus ruber TaxID=1830 RepID=UPI000EB78EB3|nr:hypothetical protein [Rhodococcus ruber]AXY51713.1 hypothetical protein YT1_2289 [Rhodococcus ruber]UQB74703.1 hypothetical protein KI427_10315 [Rhodococcus ruber]
MTTRTTRPTFTELAANTGGWTSAQMTALGITATEIGLAALDLDRSVVELVRFDA